MDGDSGRRNTSANLHGKFAHGSVTFRGDVTEILVRTSFAACLPFPAAFSRSTSATPLYDEKNIVSTNVAHTHRSRGSTVISYAVLTPYNDSIKRNDTTASGTTS